jgi:hypothetical protein
MIVPLEGEIQCLYVGGFWPYGVMEDGVLEGRDPSLQIALMMGLIRDQKLAKLGFMAAEPLMKATDTVVDFVDVSSPQDLFAALCAPVAARLLTLSSA